MMSERDERRSENRTVVDKYYSVEFSVAGSSLMYVFKIWNLSSRGICILVKNDSKLMTHLKVGDILNMKYYLNESVSPPEYLRTQIKHITKNEQGRFKGHTLVGLMILENEASDQQ